MMYRHIIVIFIVYLLLLGILVGGVSRLDERATLTLLFCTFKAFLISFKNLFNLLFPHLENRRHHVPMLIRHLGKFVFA